MRHWIGTLGMAVLGGWAVLAGPAQAQSGYTPQAVLCADGSGKLCPVIPSMIGPDPALTVGVGYQGLSKSPRSAAEDSQTPFDNMAWQMFVALNWSADGKGISTPGQRVWQTYARPEDVFGGATVSCANPDKLPTFTLIAKSDGQPDDNVEGFAEASTGKPLIDRNGNWAVFERRLNSVEVGYLKSSGLDTLAGQAKFVTAGKTVAFPEAQDATNGKLGALEMKASWRILDTAKGDDPSRYYTTRALLAVDKSMVSHGQSNICQPVTLGLVGLHIIQKNPTRGNLRNQWIWASFEHEDNAPLAQNACDPTDTNCYQRFPNSSCPAGTVDPKRRYSFYNPECKDCATNQPPALQLGGKSYMWQPTQPYAKAYMANGSGTQVARCWDTYSMTKLLNDQWRGQLTAAKSVFQNYFLVGTQWGANLEPIYGVFNNGAVPAFLANTTMETYIQTDKVGGSCISCHSQATLGVKSGTKPVPSDFSFLPSLAK